MRALALLVVVGVVGYYAVTLYQVRVDRRAATRRAPVDAIVVMGAAQYDGRPSPQLAARLDHVVELWPQGLAPLVVVTGGKQPGDRFTEAEASARYLEDRGVPADGDPAGGPGHNTLRVAARASPTLLAAAGCDEVLIVTDPYHSLRSRLIAEELGPRRPTSRRRRPAWSAAATQLRRELKEAAGVAVGRLIGFEHI